jgi:arsenate reductase-like glutaredoxin family protein
MIRLTIRPAAALAVFCSVGLVWSGQAVAQQLVKEKQKAPAGQQAQDKPSLPKPSQFLRLVKDKQGNPEALETAIVRYVPQDCGQTGPTVDLVAAVHIADKGYYQQLNQAFKKFDVVLYELVAPENVRIAKGGGARSSHPVSLIQRGMTELLDLSFQLDAIDYTAKNFVHADLSPEQLSKAMAKRGESLWTMLVRSMGYAMAKQNKGSGGSSDADLLLALLDKNRALALKRVMAEQFQDMEGMLRAMGGPDGSALIADRNQAALKVLKEQIAKGKTKIAIFYGAGHMSDMEKRLRDDFALTPIHTRWLVAWNLKGGAKPKVPEKPQKAGVK